MSRRKREFLARIHGERICNERLFPEDLSDNGQREVNIKNVLSQPFFQEHLSLQTLINLQCSFPRERSCLSRFYTMNGKFFNASRLLTRRDYDPLVKREELEKRTVNQFEKIVGCTVTSDDAKKCLHTATRFSRGLLRDESCVKVRLYASEDISKFDICIHDIAFTGGFFKNCMDKKIIIENFRGRKVTGDNHTICIDIETLKKDISMKHVDILYKVIKTFRALTSQSLFQISKA